MFVFIERYPKVRERERERERRAERQQKRRRVERGLIKKDRVRGTGKYLSACTSRYPNKFSLLLRLTELNTRGSKPKARLWESHQMSLLVAFSAILRMAGTP